jgi:hypothetical protein
MSDDLLQQIKEKYNDPNFKFDDIETDIIRKYELFINQYNQYVLDSNKKINVKYFFNNNDSSFNNIINSIYPYQFLEYNLFNQNKINDENTLIEINKIIMDIVNNFKILYYPNIYNNSITQRYLIKLFKDLTSNINLNNLLSKIKKIKIDILLNLYKNNKLIIGALLNNIRNYNKLKIQQEYSEIELFLNEKYQNKIDPKILYILIKNIIKSQHENIKLDEINQYIYNNNDYSYYIDKFNDIIKMNKVNDLDILSSILYHDEDDLVVIDNIINITSYINKYINITIYFDKIENYPEDEYFDKQLKIKIIDSDYYDYDYYKNKYVPKPFNMLSDNIFINLYHKLQNFYGNLENYCVNKEILNNLHYMFYLNPLYINTYEILIFRNELLQYLFEEFEDKIKLFKIIRYFYCEHLKKILITKLIKTNIFFIYDYNINSGNIEFNEFINVNKDKLFNIIFNNNKSICNYLSKLDSNELCNFLNNFVIDDILLKKIVLLYLNSKNITCYYEYDYENADIPFDKLIYNFLEEQFSHDNELNLFKSILNNTIKSLNLIDKECTNNNINLIKYLVLLNFIFKFTNKYQTINYILYSNNLYFNLIQDIIPIFKLLINNDTKIKNLFYYFNEYFNTYNYSIINTHYRCFYLNYNNLKIKKQKYALINPKFNFTIHQNNSYINDGYISIYYLCNARYNYNLMYIINYFTKLMDLNIQYINLIISFNKLNNIDILHEQNKQIMEIKQRIHEIEIKQQEQKVGDKLFIQYVNEIKILLLKLSIIKQKLSLHCVFIIIDLKQNRIYNFDSHGCNSLINFNFQYISLNSPIFNIINALKYINITTKTDMKIINLNDIHQNKKGNCTFYANYFYNYIVSETIIDSTKIPELFINYFDHQKTIIDYDLIMHTYNTTESLFNVMNFNYLPVI